MVFTNNKLNILILLTDSLVGVVRYGCKDSQKGGISMTANQIGLANFRESVKHNRQTEFENRRHNTATETLTGKQTSENIRHNVVSEGISRDTLAENARHNVSTEGINWYSAQNLARLQGSQARLADSDVGVRARTADITQQGNLLDYDVRSRQAATSEKQATNQSMNIDIQRQQQELNEAIFNWNKQVDKAKATQAAINNATNAITSIFSSVLRVPGQNQVLLDQTYPETRSERYFNNLPDYAK